MHFRSYADLARLLVETSDRIRGSFDLVVGIPRSGMVPASMIALMHNKPVAELDGFLEGHVMGRGQTRALEGWSPDSGDYKRILVVDDSLNTGGSIQRARGRIAEAAPEVEARFLVAYAYERSLDHVDVALEACPKPRIFEWNLLHAWLPTRACFDIDGVLCRDPSAEENDDGERYRAYLESVPPLAVPTQRIRRIVTSRLEKYRPETEAWLAAHGIEYEHLHMLDLPSARERRRLGGHSGFKAAVYASDPDSVLFVESDPAQAAVIARESGKPVLDYRNRMLAGPDPLSLAYQSQLAITISRRLRSGLARRIRRLLAGAPG
ncbi:MAG: phosphoribosyltransferase [Deltaproteobacteria bacterium]|nr:phosphoribosyltransferase [Deltaproteobacteria bacterium]